MDGVARNGGHSHDMNFFYMHAPPSHWTSLTKHRCKDKIIHNLKIVTIKHLNQAEGPFKHRTLCDCTCHTLMKVALPNIYSRYSINVLNK